jgi:hypothetical protein
MLSPTRNKNIALPKMSSQCTGFMENVFLFHMIGKQFFAFLLVRKKYFDWGRSWNFFYEHNEIISLVIRSYEWFHTCKRQQLKSLYCFSNFVIFIYAYLPKFNSERCSLIFIEIITWFTAGHYRHGVRFIESRHEIDEKVVKSSQIGDACRLKHYRWVNKHATSRQRRLKHTPWHRQSSVNHCLHVGTKNAFHNFPYLL